jgi:uncharacterized membrane protein YhaH (DUF805 family)
MSFGESVSTCLQKYFDLNGRATRSEFWWFFVFSALVDLGAFVLTATMDLSVFLVPAIVALFLPFTAAAVRMKGAPPSMPPRLDDRGSP